MTYYISRYQKKVKYDFTPLRRRNIRELVIRKHTGNTERKQEKTIENTIQNDSHIL